MCLLATRITAAPTTYATHRATVAATLQSARAEDGQLRVLPQDDDDSDDDSDSDSDSDDGTEYDSDDGTPDDDSDGDDSDDGTEYDDDSDSDDDDDDDDGGTTPENLNANDEGGNTALTATGASLGVLAALGLGAGALLYRRKRKRANSVEEASTAETNT